MILEYVLTADIAKSLERELLTCQFCIFIESSKFFVGGSGSVPSLSFIHVSCFSVT